MNSFTCQKQIAGTPQRFGETLRLQDSQDQRFRGSDEIPEPPGVLFPELELQAEVLNHGLGS